MPKKTSWQPVHRWYKKHHAQEGGFYHRELLIPKLLKIMNLNEDSSLLDVGCGEGIFERKIPAIQHYFGIDSSKSLIATAKKQAKNKKSTFKYLDAEGPLFGIKDYSHAVFLLSLQNMSKPLNALKNTREALKEGADLFLVLNHPCFRVPKASSWEYDEENESQYRRIERYLSTFKSMILAHPSKKDQSPQTPSFHYSLDFLFKQLKRANFYVEEFLEICSNKKSYGKKARAENFARKEFPLFLILHCKAKPN